MTLPVLAPRPASGEPSRVPANTRVPTVLGRGASAYGPKHEIAALVLWTLAFFLTLALASYEGNPSGVTGTTGAIGPIGPIPAVPALDGPDWVGPVGRMCARALVSVMGIVAWTLPLELALLGIPLVRGKQSPVTPGRVAGDLLLCVVASALVQVGSPGRTAFGTHPASGLVGELFGELARSLFSTAGSFLVGFACLALILIGRASFSFIALARLMASCAHGAGKWSVASSGAVADAWRQARVLERERRDVARQAVEPRIDTSPKDEAIVAAMPFDTDDGLSELLADGDAPPKRRRKVATENAPTEVPVDFSIAPSDRDQPLPVEASPKTKRQRKLSPTIVDTSAALEKEQLAPDEEPKKGNSVRFELPSIELLVAEEVDPTLAIDRDKLLANAQKLVETLAHYGVQGKVEDILPGPTVTTYEVSPAVGTKVSKVAGLADDLALALARKVRIVAPIPGKNRVGFELPNERRVPVVLRDLIEDRRFQSLSVPLPMVLGRDILGNPVYADLASMPHVIVAGATGAGKSVGLNVMLLSLLYRRSPDELRLLMIDPKVVELAPFDRIPHMLLPVVTDMKQAANALKWAVDEMERRYQLFADAGTKNVATYNAWVERVRRGERSNPNPKTVGAKDHNGLREEIPAESGEGKAQLPEKLPWIVIVVDEFADLIMQQGKEVEAAVARLAQKARAAGMHVILATQRPSTDVITGTIKANFPTRIAYRVAQKVDSRTILDEQGAEHLLGMGDMLIKLNGTGETKRVQCPWVSEEEVQRVTDFLRSQGEPVYDENILKPRDDDESTVDEADAEQDLLYDDAVRLVAETRRCSTSWLQRKLGLGYNRAARIVETMERRGLVGPPSGAKDREVLVGPL
jgi:S-DNA-T family DNA segregation ATPase FtsK/SpoIIIE